MRFHSSANNVVLHYGFAVISPTDGAASKCRCASLFSDNEGILFYSTGNNSLYLEINKMYYCTHYHHIAHQPVFFLPPHTALQFQRHHVALVCYHIRVRASVFLPSLFLSHSCPTPFSPWCPQCSSWTCLCKMLTVNQTNCALPTCMSTRVQRLDFHM